MQPHQLVRGGVGVWCEPCATSGQLAGPCCARSARTTWSERVHEDCKDRGAHDEFDPRQHYALTVADTELTEIERQARQAADSVDDIEL